MLVAVCVLLLTGCREDPPAEQPRTQSAPSASPIQTGDRMVHDIDVQQQAAREREAELDSMFDDDR